MSVLNWQKVRTHLPSKDGKYLVTLHTPTAFGLQVYADLAYYKGSHGEWYSFARVNNRDMLLENITGAVVSFIDEVVEISFTTVDDKF